MKRMGSASVTKPSFLQILMKTIIFKKVMKRLIFGRNAKESAANLWRFINPNLASMKFDFEPLRQIHLWRSHGSNLLLYKQISDWRTCNYTFQLSLINSAAIILRKVSEYLQSCLAVSNFRVTFQKEKACSLYVADLVYDLKRCRNSSGELSEVEGRNIRQTLWRPLGAFTWTQQIPRTKRLPAQSLSLFWSIFSQTKFTC